MKITLNKIFCVSLFSFVAFFFVGSNFYANAYVYNWSESITSNFVGTSATIIKNSSYWEITLTGATNGGMTIGFQSLHYPVRPMNISPWKVRYESMSGSNCVIRPTTTITNGIPGTTQKEINFIGATTTIFTFTSPLATSGMYGISVFRHLGTADCVVRLYEVLDSVGNTLWSPLINANTVQGQFYLATTSSSGGGSISFPATTTIANQNDQLWNFTLLLVIFFLTVLGTVTMLKPLYVRK